MVRSCPAARAVRSCTCASSTSRLRASAARFSSNSVLAAVRTEFCCNRESLTPVTSRTLWSMSRMAAVLRASSAVSPSTVSRVRSLSALKAASLSRCRSTRSRPSRTVSSNCCLTWARDPVRSSIRPWASAISCSLRSRVPSDRATSLASRSTLAWRAVTSSPRRRRSWARSAFAATARSLSPASCSYSSRETHEAKDSDSAASRQGALT